MVTSGMVALHDVWHALDICLPGYRRVEKTHTWWVYPPRQGEPPFTLPLGPHGKRNRVSIQRGHVKQMARQFGILDCIRANVSGL